MSSTKLPLTTDERPTNPDTFRARRGRVPRCVVCHRSVADSRAARLHSGCQTSLVRSFVPKKAPSAEWPAPSLPAPTQAPPRRGSLRSGLLLASALALVLGLIVGAVALRHWLDGPVSPAYASR